MLGRPSCSCVPIPSHVGQTQLFLCPHTQSCWADPVVPVSPYPAMLGRPSCTGVPCTQPCQADPAVPVSPYPTMLSRPCCTCVPVPSHVRRTLLYLCPHTQPCWADPAVPVSPYPAMLGGPCCTLSPYPVMLGGPDCTCVLVPSHVRRTQLYLCPHTQPCWVDPAVLCPRTQSCWVDPTVPVSPYPAMLGRPDCTCVPAPSHVRQTRLYLCPHTQPC